ncbi:MAG: nitric oxide reductase activation protein NorD [Thiohalomonadales bacterium]
MVFAQKLLQKIHQLIELEQSVGSLWHRLITRTTIKNYPAENVQLNEVCKIVGIMFRAMGGDSNTKIESTSAIEYKTSKTVLQRIAGTNIQFEFAWRNESILNLPAGIDVFPEKSLNHDLYLWLAALASGFTRFKQQDKNLNSGWIKNNQWLSCRILKRFPGLTTRYQRLVSAQLALRPDAKNLTTEQTRIELIIKQVLQNPEQAVFLPEHQTFSPQPVFLWLYPAPPESGNSTGNIIKDEDEVNSPEAGGETHEPEQQRRYQAENVEMPDGNSGLVLDRFENIFSWAEYIKVDRCTDEDEDLVSAEDSANDLDKLSIARDNKSITKRIRFDLDLPSSESDDTPLGEGILLPEWDYRKGELVKDFCTLQPMIADNVHVIELPSRLRYTAKQLHKQFEVLKPSRIWYRGQQQGSEVDLDAYLDFATEQKRNHNIAERGMYREFRGGIRDMACLLLADLSLSTDSWVNDQSRVIDVIRDSLLLFAEALSASADQFAIYGFSSRYRDCNRFHTLKTFNESHTTVSRGRINAIKPGFYTRMGAAIRHASIILSKQTASQQLLLLLTDGKPNDLDLYDGRYGIEDTRMALIEARRKGLHVFCVTIDEKAGDYLPFMFGTNNYVVIRKPSELPRELPLLYTRLSS